MSENMSLTDVFNHSGANEDVFDDIPETGDFDSGSDDVEASADLSEESQSNEPEVSANSDDDLEELIDSDIEDSSEEEVEEESEDSDEEAKEESEEEDSEEAEKEEDTDLESLLEKELELDSGDKVSIKELKNSYVGQKEIARRFSEYDVKIKQHQNDVEEINGYISTFASKLKDGDSIGAMQYFGDFAGIAPYMIKEQLIAALRPEIVRRENMSAVEVQNEYLQEQSQYLQQQRQSDMERREQEQSQAELQSSINQIREANDIDAETWEQTVQGLQQTLEEGEQLTPELVADTIKYGRMYEQAESLVTSFEGQLDNQEEWINELVSVKEKYPDYTEEDMQAVLKAAYDTYTKSTTESKLANKIESKKTKSVAKQKPKAQVVEEEIDPELEDLF